MKFSASAILARWRIVAILAVCLVATGVQGWKLTNNKGYAPQQPINFSHKLHAGTLEMDCLYCHSNAQVSRHASVPPMDTCMGCHSVVRTDRPEIKKLTEYWQNEESVPWARVWSLPDHVYFHHASHVAAGVSCQTCHGPVETMDVMYQYVDFSMGWCLSCHRNDDFIKTPQKAAEFAAADDSRFQSVKDEFWTTRDLQELSSTLSPEEMVKLTDKAFGYHAYSRQDGPGEIDHVKAFQNASINCNVCHQ